MKRLLYLDNLKVCLTVLVIFHHAGQAYGDGGGWANFVPASYDKQATHLAIVDDSWCKEGTITKI